MRRLLAIAVVLGLVASASAQSPEDNYLSAYNSALQADALATSGNDRQAFAKYLEVQTQLKKLQEEFSTWNVGMVKFRLEDVTSKLEALAKKSGFALPSATPATNAPPPALAGQPGDHLRLLQEQISQLSEQNSLLEAKLREALSVQPAALDPRDLAKAEQKVRDLQKENELLKVTLNQTRQAPNATKLEAEDQALMQAQKKLAAQAVDLASLQTERKALQGQIEELKMRLAASVVPAAEASGALISSLQGSNQALRAELALAHSTIVNLNKQAADRASTGPFKEQQRQLAALQSDLRKAREESGTLRKKLDDVNQRNRRRNSRAADADLVKQLEAAQAKLDLLEAQRVPYSTEELALLNTPLPAVPAAQTAAPNRPRELPAGAGQLMAEADRAIDAGRLDEAEKKYREVLRQDENNIVVLARLAAVLLDRGELGEAERHLEKALVVDPKDSGSRYLMGSLRAKQERYDDALEHLSLSAKSNPENPQTQFLLGRVLAQKGQRVPAETALRKAILLRPNWGDAHYALAIVYATQEPAFKELAQWHYGKARAAGVPQNLELEKAIEKAPSKQ
jgi:Flp pilus assembly protein TadD